MTHGLSSGEPKQLLIGAATSGAKFTPLNHPSGDGSALDRILRGESILVHTEEILAETKQLYSLGVRYLHWHARNPFTREQSSSVELYREFGQRHRQRFPDLALSYGASRNGKEIHERIDTLGEWTRLEHTGLPRHAGGSDFVTIQAAAELTGYLDLERQGYLRQSKTGAGYEILKPLEDYIPSRTQAAVAIEAHSTAGGANYGASSAQIQLSVLERAVFERCRLNLPQEVEWTQRDRSFALTRLLIDHFKPSLAGTGRLNVTILFGFSPKLPFPVTYQEFQDTVRLARSLAEGQSFPTLHLTVSVGAAVLPQAVSGLIRPLDVGPYRGVRVTPLERLAAYACQPDSEVDLIRFGLEDHPFLLSDQGDVISATNADLVRYGVEKITKHGGVVVTDPIRVRHFVSTEGRPYALTTSP